MTENTTNQKKKKGHDEKVMPFLDHLDELRTRLLRSIYSIILGTIICYFVSPEIVAFLTKPYPDKLIFLAPTESFMIHMKISLFAGIVLSLPVIFSQLWQFVAPGLLERERKYVPLIVFFSTFFFLLGASFCYYVIVPLTLQFFLGYQTASLEASITIKEYLSYVTLLVITFGIVFELPLLSYFLSKLGILNPSFMRKYRRHAIVLLFILAAILTPPDVISQILMALPLLILYEISILVSVYVTKSNASRSKASDYTNKDVHTELNNDETGKQQDNTSQDQQ